MPKKDLGILFTLLVTGASFVNCDQDVNNEDVSENKRDSRKSVYNELDIRKKAFVDMGCVCLQDSCPCLPSSTSRTLVALRPRRPGTRAPASPQPSATTRVGPTEATAPLDLAHAAFSRKNSHLE